MLLLFLRQITAMLLRKTVSDGGLLLPAYLTQKKLRAEAAGVMENRVDDGGKQRTSKRRRAMASPSSHRQRTAVLRTVLLGMWASAAS